MSNTFNINRFSKYFTSDLISRVKSIWSTYIIVMMTPVLLYLVLGLLSTVFSGHWYATPWEARVFWAISIIIMAICIPVMCYGKVTEKAYGTHFLMVPASVLEKTLSMVIISAIVLPFVFAAGYLTMDYLVCLVDSNAGTPLLDFSFFEVKAEELREVSGKYYDSITSVLNPALYIDDAIQLSLVFLLGAVFFKKSKVAKTILALIAFSIFTSSIVAPISIHYFGTTHIGPDNISEYLGKFDWLLMHIGLWDTISDTIVNLALCTGIYFRIKTLKH